MKLFDKCKDILKQRENSYGHSEDMFQAIANYWTNYFGEKFESEDVSIMMALMKIARERHKHSEDNIIDAINYLYLANNLINEKERQYEELQQERYSNDS